MVACCVKLSKQIMLQIMGKNHSLICQRHAHESITGLGSHRWQGWYLEI